MHMHMYESSSSSEDAKGAVPCSELFGGSTSGTVRLSPCPEAKPVAFGPGSCIQVVLSPCEVIHILEGIARRCLEGMAKAHLPPAGTEFECLFEYYDPTTIECFTSGWHMEADGRIYGHGTDDVPLISSYRKGGILPYSERKRTIDFEFEGPLQQTPVDSCRMREDLNRLCGVINASLTIRPTLTLWR